MKEVKTINDRKVTLSCRVLPEQKLIIAERANKMDMSLAQYTEAKVLRKDEFPLEKKIEKQRVEIESLKARLARMERDKNQELADLKSKYKEKVNTLQYESEQVASQNASSFVIPFDDQKQLVSFNLQLRWLAEKYGIGSLKSVLKICVRYTVKNAKASFFLDGVSGFIKENYKA